MSRVGQCPSCHTIYELDDDAVGQVMQCECNAALFICDVAGFREIPISCPHCGGEYVVDSDGAGETVECDCGQHLTVPTVVLRQPVASPGEDPQGVLAAGQQPTPVGQPVGCPGCGKKYTATGEDVGDKADCSCGCVFVIRAKQNGKLFAQASSADPDSQPASQQQDAESDEQKPPRRKRPVSLLSILGMAAVGLLLLVSIIMFATRDRRKLASVAKQEKETVTIDRQRPKAPATKPSSAQPPVADSFQAPKMTPIAAAANRSSGAGPRPIPAPPPGQLSGSSSTAAKSKSGKRISSLLAPPPEKPIPKPKPVRPVVPIVTASQRGLTFERAYTEAFEAYEATSGLKQEAEQSGDVRAYHQQLGKTIGLLQQTLDIATRQSGNDKVDELRYLLTYLHFTAGRLPEASIFGKAVARWGDIDSPATREAAMIALAATQEASETGWGDAEATGELDQMASIAAIIADRWPDHPQLDLIWMNLGQRYEAFGQSQQSADAYTRVPESSPRYGEAQLAAGSTLWAQYRKSNAADADPESADQIELLQRARKRLSSGVETLTPDLVKPTTALMAAKLSLARMALVAGDLEDAESWLVEPPMAVVDSVVVAKPSEKTVQVSEGFVRSALETLFTIRSGRRDAAGAKAALEMMAEKLGSGVDFGKMFLGVATDYIDQLSSSPRITREQFSTLSDLIEPLKEHESMLTVPNVLWLGESWSQLAERASSPQLAKQCYAKAAAAYQLAMQRSDFPAASRQAATIRRAELLRSAGELSEVLPLLESILNETPNAFAVQIEAAETIQKIAIDAGKPEQLVAAIEGPGMGEGDSTASPIWGWAKLVTTLHSAGGPESDQQSHRDRLLNCQYNLAKCQWLVAESTSDAAVKDKMLSACRRSLDRLVATTSPDHEPWYSRLQELQKQVAGEK